VRHNGDEEDRVKAEENLKAVGKQANKILTVLCGIFAGLPSGTGKKMEKVERERGRVHSAMNAFLRIAKGEDVAGYFGVVASGLAKNEGKAEERYPSLELLGILFPHLPELDETGEKPTLDAYLRLLGAEVKEKDAGTQKRAYRALYTASGKMDGERVEGVLRGLVDEEIVKVVQPSARKARLGCLANLVRVLPDDRDQALLELVPEVLPEAISGTKEAGEKARTAGFDCLVEMGRRVARTAGVKEYFAMVSAGLASREPKMQSASVACMSRLLFEFREFMDAVLVSDVVDAALFAAESKNRELAKAGLGFVKVAIVSLPQEQLEDHIERIVNAILVHSREHASHFKSKTRHIFERLIRRFSYEAVEGFVPEEDRKLLTNIRKRKERSKRRRSGAEADDEEEVRAERPGRRTFEEVMADTESEISDASDDQRERERAPAPVKVGFGLKALANWSDLTSFCLHRARRVRPTFVKTPTFWICWTRVSFPRSSLRGRRSGQMPDDRARTTLSTPRTAGWLSRTSRKTSVFVSAARKRPGLATWRWRMPRKRTFTRKPLPASRRTRGPLRAKFGLARARKKDVRQSLSVPKTALRPKRLPGPRLSRGRLTPSAQRRRKWDACSTTRTWRGCSVSSTSRKRPWATSRGLAWQTRTLTFRSRARLWATSGKA
jgi:hypothetical protein